MPISLSPRQGRYITTAENPTWAAGGVEMLATAWVRMHDRNDGSVGANWDGCTQSTETEGAYRATQRRATFVIEKKKKQKKPKETGTLTSAAKKSST